MPHVPLTDPLRPQSQSVVLAIGTLPVDQSKRRQGLQCCILISNDNDTQPERIRRLLIELEFELKRFRSIKAMMEATVASFEQKAVDLVN